MFFFSGIRISIYGPISITIHLFTMIYYIMHVRNKRNRAYNPEESMTSKEIYRFISSAHKFTATNPSNDNLHVVLTRPRRSRFWR